MFPGRNVGLKQPTQQSSTYNVTFNDQQDWSSDKAVDGSIHWGADPIELHAGSCSRTQLEHPSWWKVTFTRNMHVQRIRVKDQVYTMPIGESLKCQDKIITIIAHVNGKQSNFVNKLDNCLNEIVVHILIYDKGINCL